VHDQPELTFATVRHRTKVTKGPGSKAAGIAMAFKLIDAAQERWRAINAPHLVALVRTGGRFECGKLVERDPVLEAPKPPTTPLFSRPPPRINPSTTPRNNLHSLPGRCMIHSVRLPRRRSRSS
jgi:hypothetical protein